MGTYSTYLLLIHLLAETFSVAFLPFLHAFAARWTSQSNKEGFVLHRKSAACH